MADVESRLDRIEKVIADLVAAVSPKTCNSEKAEAIERAVASMTTSEKAG